MIRRPPRSTLSSSSAASDVYKRQLLGREFRVEGLHGDAVVVKLVAADGAGDLQDPFGRRGGAVPELGVEPDLGEVGPLHAGADLAFELTPRMPDARPVPLSLIHISEPTR